MVDISIGRKPEKILSSGEYEYINAGTTNSGYVDAYNTDEDIVTTPSRGQGGIGYVAYQARKFWCGPLCYRLKSKNKNLLTKYLYYYLTNNMDKILEMKHTGSVPALNRKELADLKIIIPPIEIQEWIVNKLDLFYKLTTDISEGLPAEIEARQKQYEYYKNKLLSFKELKTA